MCVKGTVFNLFRFEKVREAQDEQLFWLMHSAEFWLAELLCC